MVLSRELELWWEPISIDTTPDGWVVGSWNGTLVELTPAVQPKARRLIHHSVSAVRCLESSTVVCGYGGSALEVLTLGPAGEHGQVFKHGGTITATAISPQGNVVAGAGEDGMLHLWSLGVYSDHPAPIQTGYPTQRMIFSPDGREIAQIVNLGRARSFVLVWDLLTGLPLWCDDNLSSIISSIAFSGSGGNWRIIVGKWNGMVVVCDMTGRVIFRERLHEGMVTGVAMPSPNLLVSGGRDGKLVVQEISSSSNKKMEQLPGSVTAIQSSNRGLTVVAEAPHGPDVSVYRIRCYH